MNQANQAKQAFSEEVYERKRMASGARAKTGKQGHIGSMRTPADILTGAARKEYEGTGPVKTSNLYDTIMPFNEFKALSKGRKMIALYELKKRHSIKSLSEAWSISENSVYYYMRTLGVRDYENAEQAAENGKQPEQMQTAPIEQPQSEQPQLESIQATSSAAVPASKTSECDFQMHGEWTGADVAAKLQGLAKMTCSNQKYWVNISWKEL